MWCRLWSSVSSLLMAALTTDVNAALREGWGIWSLSSDTLVMFWWVKGTLSPCSSRRPEAQRRGGCQLQRKDTETWRLRYTCAYTVCTYYKGAVIKDKDSQKRMILKHLLHFWLWTHWVMSYSFQPQAAGCVWHWKSWSTPSCWA